MKISIEKASPEDSDFIAQTVMGALGKELCMSLAGENNSLEAVHRLFARLGANPKSQYSFNNTYIARTECGENVGAIIAYDGARLRKLRSEFIDAANEILDWHISEADMLEWGDETGPDQIYIDSLFVLPDYRGRGVGLRLIKHVMACPVYPDKPFGLLVEKENDKARRLYEKCGFEPVGVSNFFAAPMIHYQNKNYPLSECERG